MRRLHKVNACLLAVCFIYEIIACIKLNLKLWACSKICRTNAAFVHTAGM